MESLRQPEHRPRLRRGSRGIRDLAVLALLAWALMGLPGRDAALTYADQNSDDDFSWSYSALVFAFNGGEPIQRQDGPFDDDGGADSESLSVTLP